MPKFICSTWGAATGAGAACGAEAGTFAVGCTAPGFWPGLKVVVPGLLGVIGVAGVGGSGSWLASGAGVAPAAGALLF